MTVGSDPTLSTGKNGIMKKIMTSKFNLMQNVPSRLFSPPISHKHKLSLSITPSLPLMTNTYVQTQTLPMLYNINLFCASVCEPIFHCISYCVILVFVSVYLFLPNYSRVSIILYVHLAYLYTYLLVFHVCPCHPYSV